VKLNSFWLNIQALEVGIVDLNLPFYGFSKSLRPAFSLHAVFLLASKGRQNRPADAASPKKKSPFVAPAKLARHECKKALKVLACLPFSHLPGLYSARTVAAADTTGLFFFPADRPTSGRQAHLRSVNSPAKAGRRKYSNVYL
jgi:hypothetical protein